MQGFFPFHASKYKCKLTMCSYAFSSLLSSDKSTCKQHVMEMEGASLALSPE